MLEVVGSSKDNYLISKIPSQGASEWSFSSYIHSVPAN